MCNNILNPPQTVFIYATAKKLKPLSLENIKYNNYNCDAKAF